MSAADLPSLVVQPNTSRQTLSSIAALLHTSLIHLLQRMNGPEYSTRPLCFGSSRHTNSLITHVCQSRQAAGKLGEPAIGQKLMDGGGLHHPPCGDHRYRPEQSAAAGTSRGQNRTLWLATNCLWLEKKSYKCKM